MKESGSPVVNSNCDNFLSPTNRKSQNHVTRIQPDKFTFLKSNLLVSNILNSNPKPSMEKSLPKQSKQKDSSFLGNQSCISKYQKKAQMNSQNLIKSSDAYINCQIQRVKFLEDQQIQHSKNQRVRNLVKYRSQKTFQEFNKQQKELFQNIQNIYLMKKEMTQKAGQVMGKKQDNSYLGRNLIKQGQNFLKQLKQTNPIAKRTKLQATRLLMKQSVKKNTKNQIKSQFQDSFSHQTSRQINSMSVATSIMLQVSFIDFVQTKNLKQKEHKQELLKKLIKNKSYDNVFVQQKRRAAWEGFSEHWKKDSDRQQVQKQIKKKINRKKITKNKFQCKNHEILNYNDNFSRHLALKKYKNAFEETASTYKISQQA